MKQLLVEIVCIAFVFKVFRSLSITQFFGYCQYHEFHIGANKQNRVCTAFLICPSILRKEQSDIWYTDSKLTGAATNKH